ncbi:hypothetical protein ACFLW7_03185 [Chloroflexota bacterium]
MAQGVTVAQTTVTVGASAQTKGHTPFLIFSISPILLLQRRKLNRGAKPKVISEALGHASVAFTLDTHSHIIEGMQSDAMALLDEILPAGVNGVRKKNNAKLTPSFWNSASMAA